MSKLIVHPDSRLSEKANLVTNFYCVPTIARMMHDEMRHQNAFGLAANQFHMNVHAAETRPSEGIPQIIVFGFGATYVNPRWEPIGKSTKVAQEGCLSLPGLLLPVERFRIIILMAVTEKGEKVECKFFDLWARVIQHECDHLQGKLISDGVIL